MMPSHRRRPPTTSFRARPLTAIPLVTAIVLAAALALGPTATAASPPPTNSAVTTPCGRPTEQQPGTSAKIKLSDQGREREFILHLPDDYRQRQDWPLIVAFHGRGSTGTEIEGYSGLSTLPAVVAYPSGEFGTGEGHRRAWQGAPYAPPEVDDVAFTAALLDHVQRTWCVDKERTYATGKSNGGGLTNLLACRLPERFAAVGVVAGAFYPQSRAGCDRSAPLPIMIIHGEGDSTIPYAGDPDRDLPAIADWAADWAERNGCRAEPRTRTRGDDVTELRWGRCTDRADVVQLAVANGGHVWPGALAYSGGGWITDTIEAQTELWRFFRQHDRADAEGGDR